ncbi:hypothetical protein [Micromonospora sp. NPDC005299]|uniref:hypothetical protein n=1 Tax=Micromonospora sp. NPDC005299 TaxID=3364231 RepID=UPI0036B8AA50
MIALFLLASACTAGDRPKADATVTAPNLPPGVEVKVVGTVNPGIPATTLLSETYDITPSGKLTNPATITLPLRRAVGEHTGVLVARAEQPDGPWDLLEAEVSTDRRSVRFATDHFSIFNAIGVNLGELLTGFREDFIDPLSGGASANAREPECPDESGARGDGYRISSDSGSTVYWCLGKSGTDRILTIVNNRRYPLMLETGLPVLRKPGGELWAKAARLAPLNTVLLPPRESVTFRASLGVGSASTVRTSFDGFAWSIYALYVGVDSLLKLLTKLGYAVNTPKVEIADRLITATSCADSLGQGPVKLLAGCFNVKELVTALGPKVLLVAPLMVAGPFIEFMGGSVSALADQFNRRDRYHVAIRRDTAQPPGEGTNPLLPPPGGGSNPPPAAPQPVKAYDNYGPANAGRAMCRGNPNNALSMPGGTATQTFTVPVGVGTLSAATVQIDPDSRVTAHLTVAVNGSVVASAAAAPAGDTAFSFGPVRVSRGDVVRLAITFTATYGKIITVYTAGSPGGTFTTSNTCPDDAPNVTTSSTGLRARVFGTT